MDIYIISVVVMISQVFIYDKTSQMVPKKYMQFIIGGLYLYSYQNYNLLQMFPIYFLPSNSCFQTKSEPKRESNNEKYKELQTENLGFGSRSIKNYL